MLVLTNQSPSIFSLFFFFNDPATTEIYTLSLHDALPISSDTWKSWIGIFVPAYGRVSWATSSFVMRPFRIDRKSTRLNSSHGYISYAVFCLKKKKKKKTIQLYYYYLDVAIRITLKTIPLR